MKHFFLKHIFIICIALLICACENKTPSVFNTITMVEGSPEKEGFLPFQMFFPKNEKPYICYVTKAGKLNPKIVLDYSRKEKDESNNSVIYFFTDEWDGVYQVRVKDGIIVRMRFVNEKRNVPYSVTRCEKREIIPLEREGNMHYITVEVNGMRLKFLLDTGCSDILISLAEFTVLMKQGLLKEEDILDETCIMEIADGSLVEGYRIRLRTLKIGNKTLKNVNATIIDEPYADLLLGQGVLSQFGKYTIDNKKNELILE